MRDDEDGSTLLLTIFFGALSLAVVLLVVAATSLYLERKRLFSLADGAALAAAESFPLDTVSRDGSGDPRPVLHSRDVDEAAREYLADARPTSLRDLRLLSAGTPDGRSATVSLACAWAPPIVSFFAPEGVRIEVSATARAVLAAGEDFLNEEMLKSFSAPEFRGKQMPANSGGILESRVSSEG